MTQLAAEPLAETEASDAPTPAGNRRRKRLIATALVVCFLASAAVLVFVRTPSAGASGGCGGG